MKPISAAGDLLASIDSAVIERERIDPLSIAYTCPACSDTGYLLTQKPRGVFAKPCDRCQRGFDIALAEWKRIDKRAATKVAWRNQRPPNRRLA